MKTSDLEQQLNWSESVSGYIRSQKKALVGKLTKMKEPGKQFCKTTLGEKCTDRFLCRVNKDSV